MDIAGELLLRISYRHRCIRTMGSRFDLRRRVCEKRRYFNRQLGSKTHVRLQVLFDKKKKRYARWLCDKRENLKTFVSKRDWSNSYDCYELRFDG